MRSIVQLVGCTITAPSGGIGCAAISAGLAAISGGSIADALQAAAFAFAQVHVWEYVGTFTRTAFKAISGAGLAVAKGVTHGVVGGAIAIARGGSFIQGFAANAIGAATGVFANGIAGNNIALHTALVASAGCGAAVLSGDKCANGAVTAGFANLFNAWRGRLAGAVAGGYAGAGVGAAAGGLCTAVSGGACAVTAPLFTSGGSLIGRFLGGAVGSAIEDFVLSVKHPGQRGGPAHQGKIEERIKELEAEGHTEITGGSRGPEKRIPTPNGQKNWRQPDIASKNAAGQTHLENVGRQRLDGCAIARERRAIEDILGETGIKTKFTPYN